MLNKHSNALLKNILLYFDCNVFYLFFLEILTRVMPHELKAVGTQLSETLDLMTIVQSKILAIQIKTPT